MKNINFLLSLLLILFSCTNKRSENRTDAKYGRIVPPAVTIIANLPDSLKPKISEINALPKPQTIDVPVHSGSYYTINTGNGEQKNIKLEPPVIKSLPVLLNDKGEAVKDSSGNPFIMADGGLSNFTNFTTDNGLSLDGINCSVIDKTGNIWFGTNGGGVCKYDGKSFTTYNTSQGLINNDVLGITADNEGNMWFGTDGGLSCYDGEKFTSYTTAQGLANNMVVSIAQDKTGKIWLGTNGGGVSLYDLGATNKSGKKIFTTLSAMQGLAGNYVRSIAVDKAGNVWLGTNGGISRYDAASPQGKGGNFFTNFTIDQGLPDNNVMSIKEDKNGNLWFGTNHGGVCRYTPDAAMKPGSKQFTTIATGQGLANNTVKSIAEDNTGYLWFGTDGGGVSRYDPSALPGTSGKSLSTFSTIQGLAKNNLRSITVDKSGNLWFGTYGGGVSLYEGQAFVTFSTGQGLASNTVWSITEDQSGKMWFATYGGGVSCFDGKTFTTYTTAQGLASNMIWCITEDKTGNIWFGTQGGGVSCYSNNNKENLNGIHAGNDRKHFINYTVAQGLANNIVNCITEDKTGNLWLGTYGGGVSCFNPSTATFNNYTTAQGLAGNIVRSMAVDRSGIVWLGTDGGGVSRFDGKKFTNYTTSQGLANNTVWSIEEDKKGNIWFGTAEGLSVLMNPGQHDTTAGGTKKSSFAEKAGGMFITFTKTNGLPDDFITQVLQMPEGKMAIGTNAGIAIFQPSDDLSVLANIEIYNAATGYPVKDINAGQHGMYLDSKGVIWAGTGSEKTALVRFDPSALHKNKNEPVLEIKSIKVNEENICWNDLKEANNTKQKNEENNSAYKNDFIVTPANITEEVTTLGRILTTGERDSLRIRFGDIHFDSIRKFYPIPEHLVLPYNDNHITIDFNAVETSKPNLVNYRYMLEGYDKDWSPVLKKTTATFGNIHEGQYTFKLIAQSPDGIWCKPVTYNFRVLPPWYRTWWAYLVYTLLSLLALTVFSKWRERNLRMEKEKLERTVVRRTEELLQKNKVVENQKVTLEQQKEELIEKNTEISRIIGEREKTIEIRTAELRIANIKLKELIQYNAHNIREPLSRIMGILNMREYVSDTEYLEDCLPMMNQSVHDLDNTITQVIQDLEKTVNNKN